MAITEIRGKVNVVLERNELKMRSIGFTVAGRTYTDDITTLAASTMAALSSTNDADIYVATTGVYGTAIPIEERDSKYVFLLENTDTSAAKKVYVKAGNNPYYKGLEDLEVTVAASSVVALCLDSAKYAQYEGERASEIVFVGADNKVKVTAIKTAY